MKRGISKGRSGAGVTALMVVVVGMYLLPFILYEDPYCEVPIPGSATVHLPRGEVDLTVRSAAWSISESSVPRLSIQISGPDGSLHPELTEIRRTRYFTSEDTWMRLWVVHVEREGDYHVAVDGEVYGDWQPWLTFHHMGNELVNVLVSVGAIASSVVVSFAIVIGLVALVATLGGICVDRWRRANNQ